MDWMVVRALERTIKSRRPARWRAVEVQRPDAGASDGLHVRRVGALGAHLRVVGDLGALGERLEAAAADGGVMDEEVLALVVGRDEPEALVVVEPLHGSGGHDGFPSGVGVTARRGGC